MKPNAALLRITVAILLLFVPFTHAAAPILQWVQRYHEPGKGDSEATAMAVGANGNVTVTGYSSTVHQSSNYSTTISYSPSGVPLWTNRFGIDGNSDAQTRGIAADGSGNVFVTGSSYRTASAYDYVTVGYSSAGMPRWTNIYNGPASNHDRAFAVAVDGQGNVFVTGYSIGSTSYGGSYYDYTTIAYSGAGIPLWTNRYNRSENSDDRASAIAADTNGNVFVTGNTFRGGGYYNDYVTVAYSNAGVPLWTNYYSGVGIADSKPSAIVVDDSGDVLVTGTSPTSEIANYEYAYATIKYSGAGIPLWTNCYIGSTNAGTATGIAVDPHGNVYVTGVLFDLSESDFATVAYSGAGTPLWTNRYNGPENNNDMASAIATDNNGNVIVTGGSVSNAHYVTIGYSSAGVPLWTNLYVDARTNYTDSRAIAIAVDRSGNLYVTGRSTPGEGFGYDYTTIKYSFGQAAPLDIRKLDHQVVLSWTNPAFILQCATALTGTFTNIPAATSPYTNPITGLEQYFRLISD